jgi:hypothetical protein
MTFTINELATLYSALRLWQRVPQSARAVRHPTDDPNLHAKITTHHSLTTTDIDELSQSILLELFHLISNKRT